MSGRDCDESRGYVIPVTENIMVEIDVYKPLCANEQDILQGIIKFLADQIQLSTRIPNPSEKEKPGISTESAPDPAEISTPEEVSWDEIVEFIQEKLKKGLRAAEVYRMARKKKPDGPSLSSVFTYQARLSYLGNLPRGPFANRHSIDPKVRAFSFLLFKRGLSIENNFLVLDDKFGSDAPASVTCVYGWYKQWEKQKRDKNPLNQEPHKPTKALKPETPPPVPEGTASLAESAMAEKRPKTEEVLEKKTVPPEPEKAPEPEIKVEETRRKITQLSAAVWNSVRWRSNELMRHKKRMDAIREILAKEFNVVAPVPATIWKWWKEAQEEEARTKQAAASPKMSPKIPSQTQKKPASVQQITKVYPEPKPIRKPEVPLSFALRDWDKIKKMSDLFQNIRCGRSGLYRTDLHTCMNWQYTWRVKEPNGPVPHLTPCRLCPNWIKEIGQIGTLVMRYGATDKAEPDP